MITLVSVVTALLVAFLQTVLLYFVLASTSDILTRPGIGRLLLFHFFVCIPIGLVLPDFLVFIWNREQGVQLTSSFSTYLWINLIVFIIDVSMGVLSDSLLSVCSILLSIYCYYSVDFATNGSNTKFYPWATAFYVFIYSFFFLSNLPFLDDMYATIDKAFGATWYGETPQTFLKQWRNTKPDPAGGVSMGFGYFSNYTTSKTPSNLWNDGWIVIFFTSICTFFIVASYEWKRYDSGLINGKRDFKKLLDPEKTGLENLMRFFSATQIEALGGHSLGFANNEAVNEYIHGRGGSVFVSNISGLKNREDKNLQILYAPERAIRNYYQPGALNTFG